MQALSRRPQSARGFGSVLAVLLVACGTTTGQIHVLADADTPAERAEAVQRATAIVMNRRQPVALRMAAARALGRLQEVDDRAVAALSESLRGAAEPEDLRAMSAWALGELRSNGSLSALRSALRARVEGRVADYVLEGLAKHTALMANDEAVLLQVVEDLVFFAGNRQTELPATYHLLSERTRTVTVNVQVLERTIRRARQSRNAAENAAMYNAAYELLARLYARRNEVAAGPAAWAARVDAAVEMTGRAYATDELRTQLLVLYLLGRMAIEPEIARRVAPAVERFGIGKDARASVRLLATWALHRLELAGVAPRRRLATEILTGEQNPTLIRLIAALEAPSPNGGNGATDAPQRWLDLGKDAAR